jgi:hypothetical protein
MRYFINRFDLMFKETIADINLSLQIAKLGDVTNRPIILHKVIDLQSSKAVVPKVGCTAPWGAVGLPRWALEVGPSKRVVRLFTIDQARA